MSDDARLAGLRNLFSVFDVDGSGAISAGELSSIAERLGVQLSTEQLQEIIGQADPNGSGKIELGEFMSAMTSPTSPLAAGVVPPVDNMARVEPTNPQADPFYVDQTFPATAASVHCLLYTSPSPRDS